MGIPSYYKKLCDSIPGLLSATYTHKGLCTYMWIDFNCMIYHCLHRPGAKKYQGEETRFEFERQFLDSVCDYLEELVKIIAPTKGVYIAVDGVVPMAKIRQQRLRRFKSLWTASEEVRLGKPSGDGNSGNSGYSRWDTNAITPGTAFMEKLSSALSEVQKRHPSWKISNSDEPGEGEQKCMTAMRELIPNPTEDHVVYGLDADLIILSLLQHRKQFNITLFRESVEFGKVQYIDNKEQYNYLSIPILANALTHNIGKELKNQYILDYCMCMSFVGNDFLPHGLSLSLKNDGHSILLQLLKEHKNIVDEKTGWDLEKLCACFSWLAKNEEEWLKKAIALKKKLQNQPAKGTGWELNYDEWFKTPLRQFDEVCLTQKATREEIVLRSDWEHVYYNRYLHSIEAGRTEREYVRGLSWIFHYYMGHTVSNEWMFPWYLPPTWNCLNIWTKRFSAKDLYTSSTNIPLLPQEQLTLVLPLQSWSLIRDKKLQKVCLYSPSLWPKNFQLFMAGKRAIWECEAMIPLFTPERLRYLLRQIK